VVIGSESPEHQVIFHVVNFWNFLNPRPENAPPEYDVGRVVFEGGGWRVTLQSVPGLGDLEACLRNDSGCGITHVGRAEKVDGSAFSRKDARELFDALHSFLSFARGMWSPPILYVGVDRSGTPVWQDWTVRQASPWRVVMTWFPEHEPQCLAGAFPGFMRLWLDPDHRDILQVAIHWYIEANLGSGAIEGAVILCQNGLERLAYYIMVHERRTLRERDFGRGGLSAAERLRRLKAWHDFRGTITLHPNLCFTIADVVWDLFIEGLLRPGFNDSNRNLPFFHLTDFGKEAIKDDSTPYDPDGYIKSLKNKVPNIDPVIVRYVTESAQTLRQNCLLSSTVTLGCASEQAFPLLIEAYHDALNAADQTKVDKDVNSSWMIKHKHTAFMKWYESALKPRLKVAFSSDQIGELDTALDFVFTYFRKNRNDVGHPSDVPLSRATCTAHLTIFPSYLRVFYDLMDWLKANKPL